MAVAGATSASSGATASEQARKLRTLPFPTLTTPARLRLGGIVLVGALAVLAIVGVRTALDRAAAADAVAGDATPLLVGAENLYVALADADAAASTAFLRAGLEPPNLRARYLDDLETAGRQLADLATQSNPSATSSAAIAQIAQLLPAYAGQVEAARTNNRLDFPLGAAYLRRASDSMRTSILPAARALYDDAARQLYGAYADGTAARDRELLLGVTGVVMAILIVVQVMVALRTRRVLNLGLVGATVIVAALGVGALIVLDAQERALVRSQREGADQLIVLSTMRILALRSLSDENLNLIERGTEAEYREDLAAVTASVGGTDGSGGLLGNAAPVRRADREVIGDRPDPRPVGRLHRRPRPGAGARRQRCLSAVPSTPR